MDKTDHLMAYKSKNNKDSRKGQVTSKKYLKKEKKILKVICLHFKIEIEMIPFIDC